MYYMSEILTLRRFTIKHLAASLAVTALFLSGCGESKPTSPPRVKSVNEVPNFSKLTKGGVSCEQGYPRPCYQPLYKSPKEERPLTTNDIVNAYSVTGNIAHVDWPYEAYRQHAGNSVSVVCQVKGESISNAYGQSTKVWDVIKVPVSEINSQALFEAESGNASFGVEKNGQGKVEAIFAYASSIWLGGTLSRLGSCSQTENPSGYPNA